MPRTARLRIKGEPAYYHIVSRTIHKQFLLGDVEKEKLIELIKKYQKLYLVKILGYAVMSNHFHLLVKTETDNKLTDEDIQRRVEKFYGKPLYKIGITVDKFREKLTNVSEYVKLVKQTFSWWYNRQNNQTGTLWSERFKSGLVENGTALLTVLSYIDLNPVRAGIVTKPERYRFSSIGYRVQSGNLDGVLTFEGIGLVTDNNIQAASQSSAYLSMLYSYGHLGQGQQHTPSQPVVNLSRRLRYMTDGVVIGSKAFVMKAYALFGGTIIKKKERKVHKTGVAPDLFSIRKLRS